MMTSKTIYNAFKEAFDVVGIIKTKSYQKQASIMGKDVPNVTYPTMVVVALSYPMRIMKHTKTHLIPSFYTFGKDYHLVLKNRIKGVMDQLKYPYVLGVDNHPHNERLAATLAGIGYFGKNQLIINKEFGTYMFLGVVFIDVELDQTIVLDIDDDCGDCRKCIDACPVNALYEGGYHLDLCMSHYNQEKRVLSENEILKNYNLFGCDICQMVCPKNIQKGTIVHKEFELSGKEAVSILDLFTLSDQAFKDIYKDMAYMWKGKSILMRNALALMLRRKQSDYIDLIEASLKQARAPWYQQSVKQFLEALKK